MSDRSTQRCERLERDGLAQSDDVEDDERQKNYRITANRVGKS